MVVRTTESADVSREPQRALSLLPWSTCGWEVHLVGASAPSQVYKLLTAGRYRATQSDTESLSLKILLDQEGPGCPRTKDVGRLPEGPLKALAFPAKSFVLAELPLQASNDRKRVSMLVFVL